MARLWSILVLLLLLSVKFTSTSPDVLTNAQVLDLLNWIGNACDVYAFNSNQVADTK